MLRKTVVSILMLSVMGAVTGHAWALSGGDIKFGNRLFQKGDYDGALKSYRGALEKDPNSELLHYNIGSVLYKKKDYAEAIHHLRRSLLTTDKDLESRARYNLGLGLYGQGRNLEQSNLEEAVKSVEDAVDQYEKYIKSKPKDEAARQNQKIFKEELERLKKLLEQQKKQKQQNKQDGQGPSQPQQDHEQNKQETQDNSQSQSASSDQNSNKEGSQNSENELNNKQSQGPKEDFSKEQKTPQLQEGSESSGQEGKNSSQDRNNSSQDQNNSGEKQAGLNKSEDAKQLSEDEANRLLKSYQQSEEPQGLLIMRVHPSRELPVEKDW